MSIGYACIHIGSTNTKQSSLRLKSATDDNIRSVIARNFDALEAIIKYNADNRIRLFRISSDIIPLGSHPENRVEWNKEFDEKLKCLGNLIADSKIRVSMHPGQYTVLNSLSKDVAQRAVDDLEYHCRFLDSMGCDESSKIVLHIGGGYSDKKTSIKRFIENYEKLSSGIKKRLVVENDDKVYNVDDVLFVSKLTGIPVVFDNLHHELNAPDRQKNLYESIDECRQTWKGVDGLQKIHYSQRSENGKRGAHSKTIRSEEFLGFHKGLHTKDVDIMLEVKDKNLSAVKCLMLTAQGLHIKYLEREWARYKYLVLSKSASLYNDIRSLLKDKDNPDALLFYKYIEQALSTDESIGAGINAAAHVWGYLNNEAFGKDKKRFEKLIDGYTDGTINYRAIKNHLFKLAKEQDVVYLLDSLYFYLDI